MSNSASVDDLVQDIRRLYLSNTPKAEANIDRYLQSRLQTLSEPERLAWLEKLTDRFAASKSSVDKAVVAEEAVLTRLISLVLGAKFTELDLLSAEVTQRLTDSLNTVFDELNRLIFVIRSTLTGIDEGDQTIRHFIGSHMEGADQTESLQTYLGEISNAFLLAQRAFKQASRQIVEDVLNQLDPEKISQEYKGGLRFGPLRKAELYDIYEQRFKECRQWHEAGRMLEDFQRLVEKYCQAKVTH
ncbi:MAG: hypothetical protein QNJ58_11220 [Desulfobacterales bacterium]|nr:hypothetical protein [Desulfobacterales bacterium]